MINPFETISLSLTSSSDLSGGRNFMRSLHVIIQVILSFVRLCFAVRAVVGKVRLRSRMRLFGPLNAALVQISMDSRIAPMVSVALEKNIIWNIFIDAPIDMATKKKQRKTEDENREFRVEWTENFAFIRNLNGRHVLFVRRNSRITRSQTWTFYSMRHLALNIPPVMQGRKQLRNFRRVKSHQLLYLITGCNLPAILIWQVLLLAKRLLKEGNRTQTANT